MYVVEIKRQREIGREVEHEVEQKVERLGRLGQFPTCLYRCCGAEIILL